MRGGAALAEAGLPPRIFFPAAVLGRNRLDCTLLGGVVFGVF